MKLSDIENAVLIWGPATEDSMAKLKEWPIVVVPENRPGLTGLYHNVPLLKKEKVNFVYCTDNMLGLLFYQGKIRKTILYYKQAIEGKIVGVSGSLYVSLLSKLHKVNVEFVMGEEIDLSKFDQTAANLGGKKMILGDKEDKFIPRVSEELIEDIILRIQAF